MQWGAWAVTGMASQNANVLARIERSGMGLIQPIQGLWTLHLALNNRIGPLLVVNPFRWHDMSRGRRNIPAIFSEQISHATPQVLLKSIHLSLPSFRGLCCMLDIRGKRRVPYIPPLYNEVMCLMFAGGRLMP